MARNRYSIVANGDDWYSICYSFDNLAQAEFMLNRKKDDHDWTLSIIVHQRLLLAVHFDHVTRASHQVYDGDRWGTGQSAVRRYLAGQRVIGGDPVAWSQPLAPHYYWEGKVNGVIRHRAVIFRVDVK